MILELVEHSQRFPPRFVGVLPFHAVCVRLMIFKRGEKGGGVDCFFSDTSISVCNEPGYIYFFFPFGKKPETCAVGRSVGRFSGITTLDLQDMCMSQVFSIIKNGDI